MHPPYFDAINNQLSTTNYGVAVLGNGGSRWMPEIGLYDDRNRFMSPDLGRFLQPDPIGFKGDASNLYRYCGNDWANRADPMGTAGEQNPQQKPTELPSKERSNEPSFQEKLSTSEVEQQANVDSQHTANMRNARAEAKGGAMAEPSKASANAANISQTQTATRPTSHENADVTIFVGFNGSLIPFAGPTVTVGGYVSPQGVGIFFSRGGGYGFDVSYSPILGYTKTNLDGFRGSYDNTSFGVWKIGVTGLRSNGETVGHAVTFGPGLTPISGSQTHTDTTVTTPVRPSPPILAGPF